VSAVSAAIVEAVFLSVASRIEGKMFERETFGRALSLHRQGRVIVHGAKTIVFH
jgi:formyltetrahydrofolate hydrolase